jgi:hypothetical protein
LWADSFARHLVERSPEKWKAAKAEQAEKTPQFAEFGESDGRGIRNRA